MNTMKPQFHHVVAISLFTFLSLTAGCRRNPIDRALSAIEGNNPSLAESLLSSAAEVTPDDPVIQANLAIARMKLGQIDAALAGFRRAADLAPADPRPLEFMASLAASEGRWRMSLELLIEAERRDQRSPRLQTALAISELKATSPQAAQSRLTQVLGVAPNYSPALFNLAVIMQDYLNNPAEAIQLFERYITLSGDSSQKEAAKLALVQLNGSNPITHVAPISTKPPPNASGVTTQAKTPVSPTPSKPVVRHPQAAAQAYNNGVRHHTRGNLDNAIKEYEKAIQADPTMASAHYNLGLIYKTQNVPGEARQAFQRALELNPGMLDARYMLAIMQSENGQTDAAIENLQTLLSQAPTYAQAHQALGMIFARNPSTIHLARREFEKYIELEPKGPHTQMAHDWLKYNKAP